MSTAAPALSPAPPAASGADFADWLSPILVKELRQGLKSRVFVSSFIVMQVVMILTMGLKLLEHSGDRGRAGGSGFDGIFWSLLWLPLLVLMPARGLGAVHEEARANTFDLVQLTRLTAFRIVLGKWLALFAQTLLLAAALLPYAVLRYYFGGVDVMGDLTTIAVLLMISMVLTAGAVALSAAPLAVRILVLIGALPMMTTLMSGFALVRSFGGRGPWLPSFAPTGSAGLWLLPAITLIYVAILLEFAAAKIAPLSENHAARKRGAVLALTAIAAAAGWLAGPEWFLALFAAFLPLLIWVTVDALSEATVALPAVYAPWARRGVMARALGRLLYPGWATAVLFTALTVTIGTFAVQMLPRPPTPPGASDPPIWIIGLLVLFALLSPLPIMLFFPRVKQRFWLYLLIQLGFLLLFAATSLVEDTPLGRGVNAYHWLVPLPPSALLAVVAEPRDTALLSRVATVTLGCGILLLLFLAFHMRREFRLIARLERASLGGTPPARGGAGD